MWDTLLVGRTMELTLQFSVLLIWIWNTGLVKECLYVGHVLRSVSLHLLIYRQFVLPLLRRFFDRLVLSPRSLWCFLCVAIFDLVRWWGMTMRPPFHMHILPLFISWRLLIMTQTLILRARWRLGVPHEMINSRTILVTWLKPSNRSRGFRLTSSSTAVNHTCWTCVFPCLTVQRLIQMLHYMSKIDHTNLLCNIIILIILQHFCLDIMTRAYFLIH